MNPFKFSANFYYGKTFFLFHSCVEKYPSRSCTCISAHLRVLSSKSKRLSGKSRSEVTRTLRSAEMQSVKNYSSFLRRSEHKHLKHIIIKNIQVFHAPYDCSNRGGCISERGAPLWQEFEISIIILIL